MSENYKYSIQDAFKSLEMIDDEMQGVVTEKPVRTRLTEKVKKESILESTVSDDENIVTETLDHDKIDEEMEKEYKRIALLKERYDANPASITPTELKELVDLQLVGGANEEVLTEDKIGLNDKEAIEAELAELEKDEVVEPTEIIVDVEAETEEDLRDSYVGSYILECAVCKTLIYKDKEDIIPNEEDETDDHVNYEDECPHCKTEDAGFKIIGKVAPIEDEEEVADETKDEEESDDEPKEDDDNKSEEEPEKSNEEIKNENDVKESVESIIGTITDLDEASFNTFATKYLKEVYANVKGFKTINAEIDEDLNTIVLEGTIEYVSGKSLNTKFVFESIKPTKRGKIRLVGLNEALSNSKKAYQLVASLEEGKLKVESLTYNYAVKVNEELRRLYGRIS